MIEWVVALAQSAVAGVPWGVILPVAVTALATLAVGVYTARSARAANRETSQITGWRDQVASWRADVEQLRRERREDEERFESERRADLKRHEAEREEDRRRAASEVARCHARIDELTRTMEEWQAERREFIAWARTVVALMRDRGLAFPPPPRGIED